MQVLLVSSIQTAQRHPHDRSAAGMNVLLVSRNSEKLKAAAAQIEAQWGVQCKYHAIDLVEAAAFRTDHDVWARLQAVIDGVDVGLLVNNAGACYAYPELFSALDRDTLHDLPAINVSSLVKMTHLVLPGMVGRNRGAIVNVSSVSAARTADGCPLVSLYAATKACVTAFSVALAEECRPAGVHVQVRPLSPVRTGRDICAPGVSWRGRQSGALKATLVPSMTGALSKGHACGRNRWTQAKVHQNAALEKHARRTETAAAYTGKP